MFASTVACIACCSMELTRVRMFCIPRRLRWLDVVQAKHARLSEVVVPIG